MNLNACMEARVSLEEGLLDGLRLEAVALGLGLGLGKSLRIGSFLNLVSPL